MSTFSGEPQPTLKPERQDPGRIRSGLHPPQVTSGSYQPWTGNRGRTRVTWTQQGSVYRSLDRGPRDESNVAVGNHAETFLHALDRCDRVQLDLGGL